MDHGTQLSVVVPRMLPILGMQDDALMKVLATRTMKADFPSNFTAQPVANHTWAVLR